MSSQISTYKVILFTVLLLQVFMKAAIIKDKCLTSLKNSALDITNLDLQNITNPLLSMGSNLNDFGNYDQCLSNKENTYFMLRVYISEAGQKLPVYMGMCLNKEDCDNEETKLGIRNMTLNTLGKSLNVSLEDIYLHDVQEVNSLYKTPDAFSYIVIIVLVFYVFVVCTGLLQAILEYVSDKCSKPASKPRSNSKSNDKPKISYSDLNAEETNKPIRESKLSINEDDEEKNQITVQDLDSNKHSKDQLIEEKKAEQERHSKIKKKFGFLSIFNYSKNYSKLFTSRESKDDAEMKLLDGIRSITCFYIIIAHSFVFLLDTPVRNNEGVLEWVRGFINQIISNCSFIVDSFLGLSGFFLSYIGLKKLSTKESGIMIVLKGIAFRILRIWPLYMAVFLITWKILPLFGDGPIFGLIFNNEIGSCFKQWPFMIFMIENYSYGRLEDVAPVCLGWYWYIPIDFQLYIIGVILIVLHSRNRKIFYIVFSIILATGFTLEIWTLIKLDYGVNPLQQGDVLSNFRDYYVLIYNRCSPFFIGFISGIFYLRYKRQIRSSSQQYSRFTKFLLYIKENKGFGIFFFFLNIGIITFIVFIVYNSYYHEWPKALNFLYLFFSRKVFVLCLFMCFFVMFMGHLSGISNFLSAEIFVYLTKLSYANYLIHPAIIKFCYYSFRQAFYWNAWVIGIYSIAFMLTSSVFSIFFSVLFEIPFGNIRTSSAAGQKKSIKDKIHENKEEMNMTS